MQNWVVVDEQYLNYLRAVENRIPMSNYGRDKLKPFFGVLFEVGDLAYVTQISHAQPRHIGMRDNLDFKKIYLASKQSGKADFLAAVVNLNYMFPVPKNMLNNLEYKDIDKHRTFASEDQKSKYIDLLRDELSGINTMNIDVSAKKLYDLKEKYPESFAARRCVDFKMLEGLAHQYAQENKK